MKKISFVLLLVFFVVFSLFSAYLFLGDSIIIVHYLNNYDFSCKTFFIKLFSIALHLFSSVFYLIFAIRLIRKGNVINEIRYTYDEYKAKRDAEKSDREAAAKEARRAELERELAELKKTE